MGPHLQPHLQTHLQTHLQPYLQNERFKGKPIAGAESIHRDVFFTVGGQSLLFGCGAALLGRGLEPIKRRLPYWAGLIIFIEGDSYKVAEALKAALKSFETG